MPVSACVDVWQKDQIMRFEMEKDPEEITEQDWINSFRETEQPDCVDLPKIDTEMRRIRLGMTLEYLACGIRFTEYWISTVYRSTWSRWIRKNRQVDG